MKTLLAFLLSVLSVHAAVFTHDPDANRWQTGVVTNSGAAKGTTVWAVNRLAVDIKREQVWNDVKVLNPVAGDNLNASLVRLKVPSGVAVAETATSFVAGDYSLTTGRTGDGTSKYVNTLINPRALGFSTNSLGLWISAMSTQAMGTTRIMIGNTDGGGNVFDLGVINNGAVEVGVVGAANTTEYPGGTNTSITGFLGVNVKSFPFYMAGTAASITSPGGGTGSGFQGITSDGTYGYLTYSTRIVKYQLSDNVSVLTNSSPFTGSGMGTLDHLGDPCVYDGKLIIASEAISAEAVASNACFLVYDPTDLTLLSAHSISNITSNIGGAVVGGDGILYAISGALTQLTNIFKFNPDTFEYLGSLTMDIPIPVIQGIEWTPNGYLLISEGGSASPDNADFYLVDPATGQTDMVNRYGSINEAEGINFQGTNVVLAAVVGSTCQLKYYPFFTNFISVRHSQQYYWNGLTLGMPALGTVGLANNNIYMHAINNGTAALYSARRLGLYAITEGLTTPEIRSLNSAVQRFNAAIGR